MKSFFYFFVANARPRHPHEEPEWNGPKKNRRESHDHDARDSSETLMNVSAQGGVDDKSREKHHPQSVSEGFNRLADETARRHEYGSERESPGELSLQCHAGRIFLSNVESTGSCSLKQIGSQQNVAPFGAMRPPSGCLIGGGFA